ncbi:hypothetical protein [Saccharothrix syringae]|uniref:Uncharacterized protein n=1 Tax=Saccharothrix syringae TaxID=103733 RepID=A0A5Q0H202_SACSY|nr:hypothetical protein [Saccharothrix syringae]QFZ20277.1 hypothetical protein EKG83_25215 [Saccharothrix syringae]
MRLHDGREDLLRRDDPSPDGVDALCERVVTAAALLVLALALALARWDETTAGRIWFLVVTGTVDR